MNRHVAKLELLAVRFSWIGKPADIYSKTATECLKRASQAERAGFREDSEELLEISEFFRSRAGLRPGVAPALRRRPYR